jgi:membrane-associated phospholipid phosphatase
MDNEMIDQFQPTDLPAEQTVIAKELSEVATKALAEKKTLSRRHFLGNVSGAAAVGMAVSVIGVEPLLGSKRAIAKAEEIGPETPAQRLFNAGQVRLEAIARDLGTGIPPHPTNDDEQTLINFVGNYSKCLKHDSFRGEVLPSAYNAFRAAVTTGTQAAFESLVTNGHFGAPNQNVQRRFKNPLAGYAYDLESKDSHQYQEPPAPDFSSAEEAGEIVENYWMALLRDVNFSNYGTNATAIQAAADLSNLSDFRGAKQGGVVTAQTLFRDPYPGCTTGPYVSQFLLQDVPYGAITFEQRIRTAAPNIDFGTTFNDWLDLQNGVMPATPQPLDGLRYIRRGRDGGQYVHVDALYQAHHIAALILLGLQLPWDENLTYGQLPDPAGVGVPLPVGMPGTKAQCGFITGGAAEILSLLTDVATIAGRAQWYQKWLVHRRLRPEAFAGRVEVLRLGRRTLGDYPINSDLFNSNVLNKIFTKYGNHLLPLAFPEGSPTHPSYGSGHATIAGACITVLKAFFDEDTLIPNPVQPSNDGLSLVPFAGPLTVGGELNKLASNISQFRNIAGVHWRADARESNFLGEKVALSYLANYEDTLKEPFGGFKLTKFDGTTITT